MEKKSFILKAGDSLHVMKKTGLIMISGEVNVPGFLSYEKNLSLKEYIQRAGGFSPFAQKGNIYVIYPNGISMVPSRLGRIRIKEGSEIVVNQRTISGEQKLNGFQAFSMISNQAGNIATALLSLSLLLNQSNNGN